MHIWLNSRKEYRNKESSQTTLEAETDEARSKDLKMKVTKYNEISSIEKSLTNLDLARDREIIERRENIRTDGMNRDRTCASIRHPSPCRDKTGHLTTELSASTKNRCFGNSNFYAGLNRLRSWIAKNDQVIFLQDINKLASNGS